MAPPTRDQIPPPSNSPYPAWPTPQALVDRRGHSHRSHTQHNNYGLDLPCASYTDEICYQQQVQLKPNEIHKCCRERILLTDQCLPGRCSNVTQQLCCIQRFLQAKVSCCNDDAQATTPTGDHFSRCCHENFVGESSTGPAGEESGTENACCPRAYARSQWRSVAELCLPNVEIDLSKVRVPSLLPGTSLTTEYDFAKAEDKWKFKCPNGAHVPQFVYLESESDED